MSQSLHLYAWIATHNEPCASRAQEIADEIQQFWHDEAIYAPGSSTEVELRWGAGE